MFGLSWWHILLVLVVFVLLFGAGRISGLMGDVAKGLKSFKKGLADEDEEAHRESKPVEHKGAKESPNGRQARSKVTKSGRKTA